MPAESIPWRQAEFCVVDLETTGLDPDRDEIISFASIGIANGRISLTDQVLQLVHPDRMPEAESIRIHGLRETDLADAPPLEEAIARMLQALAGKALVAHVAAVESGFLGRALGTVDLELRNPIVDTAAMAAELRRRGRRSLPNRAPAGLSDLARSLGLPVHRPHHADGDALTTAQVFLALATHLDAIEPQTVESLEALEYGGAGLGILTRLRRIRDRSVRSSARP